MPTALPNSSGASSVYWGGMLAAASILLIGGGAIIWSHRAPSRPTVQLVVPTEDDILPRPATRLPPRPPFSVDPKHGNVHSIAYAVENGTPVVKIKVVADGDELIVDAVTGRLLETRPSRPTAPPPMGKFARAIRADDVDAQPASFTRISEGIAIDSNRWSGVLRQSTEVMRPTAISWPSRVKSNR